MRTRFSGAALLGAVLTFSACAAGAQNTSMAAPTGNERVYVANQGGATISVFDLTSMEVVQTIDLQQLGFSATAKPHHIVVDRDGAHWYVSLIGENTVLKFDRTGEIVGRATFEVPGMMAENVSGDQLFVGRSMSAVNPPRRIGVIEKSDMSVDEIDVFFPRPHALAVHPDGRHVFSASLAENRFVAIDVPEEAQELVSVDGPVHTVVQFAVSPDGNMLVASTQMTGLLLLYDVSDPMNPRRVGEVDVGGQVWHPLFTRDGNFVYVGSKGTNTITIIDTRAGTVAKVLRDEGISAPHGSALSADGRYVLITQSAMDMSGGDHAGMDMGQGGNSVAVIDVASQEIVRFIDVGKEPSGIGTRPGS